MGKETYFVVGSEGGAPGFYYLQIEFLVIVPLLLAPNHYVFSILPFTLLLRGTSLLLMASFLIA